MGKTLANVKNDTIVLINNKSASGQIIPDLDGNQMDYLLRIPSLANAAQMEIATTYKKIVTHFSVSQYPAVNGITNPSRMFDIYEHTSADVSFLAPGAAAYYFEVDNLADIYIEEEVNGAFQPLSSPIHIQVSEKPSAYQAFKGFITPSDPQSNVRIRFSGDYEYRIRNVALYTSKFASADDIPAYTRYNSYTMPADFFQLMPDGITFKGNNSDGYPFVKTADYFWQGFNTLCINYYNRGEYTVYYYRYPTTIGDDTPDTYTFEIDPEAQELIPYYVAAHILMDEKPNIGTLLLNEYNNKLAQLSNPDVYGKTEIENTTGW